MLAAALDAPRRSARPRPPRTRCGRRPPRCRRPWCRVRRRRWCSKVRGLLRLLVMAGILFTRAPGAHRVRSITTADAVRRAQAALVLAQPGLVRLECASPRRTRPRRRTARSTARRGRCTRRAGRSPRARLRHRRPHQPDADPLPHGDGSTTAARGGRTRRSPTTCANPTGGRSSAGDQQEARVSSRSAPARSRGVSARPIASPKYSSNIGAAGVLDRGRGGAGRRAARAGSRAHGHRTSICEPSHMTATVDSGPGLS